MSTFSTRYYNESGSADVELAEFIPVSSQGEEEEEEEVELSLPLPTAAISNASRKSCHGFKGRLFLTLVLLIINFLVYWILSNFELSRQETTFKYQIPNVSSTSHTHTHFFRIQDTRGLSYDSDIIELNSRLNNKTSTSSTTSFENLLVDEVGIWSSDALRFDFIIKMLESHSSPSSSTSTTTTTSSSSSSSSSASSSYICIMESDIVINRAYFADTLKSQRPAVSWIQHFWAHRVFEPFNIGVLCAPASPHNVPWATRQWFHVMRALYSSRFRRLLPLDLLFSFITQKYVFGWDSDHGCTTLDSPDRASYCNYIHFTRPKQQGIATALKTLSTPHSD